MFASSSVCDGADSENKDGGMLVSVVIEFQRQMERSIVGQRLKCRDLHVVCRRFDTRDMHKATQYNTCGI